MIGARSGNTWLLFDVPRLLPLPALSRALPVNKPEGPEEGAGLMGLLFKNKGGGQTDAEKG